MPKLMENENIYEEEVLRWKFIAIVYYRTRKIANNLNLQFKEQKKKNKEQSQQKEGNKEQSRNKRNRE